MTQEEKKVLKGTDANKDCKRSRRRSKGRDSDGSFRDDVLKGKKFKGGNDFAFWNEYPELMETAARIPWMHVPGTPLRGNQVYTDLPNVLRITWQPIPGVQDSASSPLNLAFRQMYLDMHRKYRGIGAYQASDIAITVLCIESALQKLVEAERVYGILNTVPVASRIQPLGVLRTLGYTGAFLSDCLSHMADFRYGINRLIDLARRLPLPTGMSFFSDHVTLNGFVYKDSEDERADYIIFQCTDFFEYVTTGSSDCINSAGTAKLVNFSRGGFSTYSALLANIESSLKTLLYDSDILRITSDFIACYGEDNMQVIMPLPEDFKIYPVYNDRILLKVHNCEPSQAADSYVAASSNTTKLANYAFSVYQEDDVIYSMPCHNGSSSSPTWTLIPLTTRLVPVPGSDAGSFLLTEHLVDTWEKNPGVDTCCEAVLWKAEGLNQSGTGTTAAFYVTKCSTVYVTNIFTHIVSNGNLVGSSQNYSGVIYSASLANKVVYLMQVMHFDWHPMALVTSAVSPTKSGPISQVSGDTDNISVVSSDVIAKIHDAAVLSAFTVKVQAKGRE